MTKDYCEILLDSVRTVVDVETYKKEKNADHVEICTIIDNTGAQDEDIVYYWVQNESGQKYQVQSELKNLRLDDQLYVQVLSNGGRMVLGRKLSDANLPISVVQAFDRFFALETYKADENQLHEVVLIDDYDRLGIECIVDNKQIAQPDTIGKITIELLLNNGNIYNVSFSTADMLGDPNTFYELLQKKVFDISNLGDKIKQIKCVPSDGRFSQIIISLGYDLDSLQGASPLYLYTNDSTEYKTDINSNFTAEETEKRTLVWRWIYEDENGELQGLSSADPTPDGYEYHLYYYNEDNNTGDIYGGLHWERKEYTLLVNLDSKKKENKYKLIITYNGTYVVSNEIVFINNQIEKPTTITDLKFVFSDKSNGQYPYYEYDGYLSEIYFHESLAEREVTAQFNIEESATIEKIVWTVPIDLITITKAAGKSQELENSVYDEKEVIEVIPDNSPDLNYYTLTYKIKENSHFVQENDQYLKCAIYVDGEDAPYTYEQQIVLRVEGENGTDNYILARFYDAKGNLKHYIKPGEKAWLEVRAFNGEGLDITENINSIKYNWIGQRQYIEYDEFGNVALNEDGTEKERGEFLLVNGEQTGNIQPFEISLPEQNENVPYYLNLCPILHLEIKFTGESADVPVLTKDLTLPINYSDDYILYTGPTIIKYDYEGGNPICARTQPALLDAEAQPVQEIKWYLVTNDNFSGYPEFNQKTLRLDPRAAYDSQLSILVGEESKRDLYLCNLIGYQGSAPDEETGILKESDIVELYWIQPIQIVQNRYFSTIIDNWDGAMEINEEGNYILASTFAAGNKNEYNQFSGTMIGTFGTLIDSENHSTETGIKGFKDGMQVYEFNDSGKATIGPSGSGQIQFDGWMGSIKSGGFDGELDETANRVVYDINKIGSQGSYWNLNTGELITNDGYFRGSLYADKLFISDEVKEESGITSTSRFETYADAEKAIFESEVEYLTHTDDTETRANAVINSFVDEQQAINSMQASYSFDKAGGIPTENYNVVWNEDNNKKPSDIDYTRIYTEGGYANASSGDKVLVKYTGIWTDYFILPADVTGVKHSAFDDANIDSNFIIYYQTENAPKKYQWVSESLIQMEKLSSSIKNINDYPRMEWIKDGKHQYFYQDKLWYYKDKWYNDGDLYQNILDILDNRYITSWQKDKRYRCKNFYTYLFRPIKSAKWKEDNKSVLPAQGIKYDPGIKNRILGEEYYSKSPTGVMINETFYPIAENNDKVPQDFFRYCGGKYLEENKYINENQEEIIFDTNALYYSYEYKAYYQYAEEINNNNFLSGGRWIVVDIIESNLDPTDRENLGKWNPKTIIKYNGKYYSYNFKGNRWRPRATKPYENSAKLKGNNFNNAKSIVWLTFNTQAIVYFDAPIGHWKMFRLNDDEKSNLRYTKYSSDITFFDSEINRHLGPVKEINGLIQKSASDVGEKGTMVIYNKDYYIATKLDDNENYNFYKLTEEKSLTKNPDADNGSGEATNPNSNRPYIYNYEDRLCMYDQENEVWKYDELFKASETEEDIKTYNVDEGLNWTGTENESENIYHLFDGSRIYKVGEDFYQYDEELGWHKIKTAAATSASLVQWANAAGAQSALTTQFIAGLNKTIKAVPSFDPDNPPADVDKNLCYYDLTEGKYWVWDNRKWVEYEPSMSTSAQIKQIANAAKAQIDLTTKFDIDVEEIVQWDSSEEHDTDKAYYDKTQDTTYIYVEKEEDYNTYVEAMYEIAPDWSEPGWYYINEKLQPSMSAIDMRATGLESRMSLTVGYGDNADLKWYVVNNPVEFNEKFSTFVVPSIIYIVKAAPYKKDTVTYLQTSGYYYKKGTSIDQLNYYSVLPETITINGEEIKIPQMAGISMAADAAGGSIDFIFGPAGEGHILELQDNGDVYLKAKDISFDVGGTMKLIGDKSSSKYPLFNLVANIKDTTANNEEVYYDTLDIGGASIQNGYFRGNRYYLSNWIEAGFNNNWTYSNNVLANSIDTLTFAITQYASQQTDTVLAGFSDIGNLYAQDIYGKSLYIDNIQTIGSFQLLDNWTNKKELIYLGIDTIGNPMVRAKRMVSSESSISSNSDINGFYIKNCAIDTISCVVGDLSTKIDDYFLKKNDLTASLTSVTLAKQSDFIENGVDGPVTYYSLISENLPNSTSIGKITYNGNNYYLVNDVSSDNKVPGYTKTAIQVPLFNDGYYYSISQVSGDRVQKITIFDWGETDGTFYRGNPWASNYDVTTYVEGDQVDVIEITSLPVYASDVGKTAYFPKVLTEDDVGKTAFWTSFSTYYKKGTESTKTIQASYTMGNSSVSIYPIN